MKKDDFLFCGIPPPSRPCVLLSPRRTKSASAKGSSDQLLCRNQKNNMRIATEGYAIECFLAMRPCARKQVFDQILFHPSVRGKINIIQISP